MLKAIERRSYFWDGYCLEIASFRELKPRKLTKFSSGLNEAAGAALGGNDRVLSERVEDFQSPTVQTGVFPMPGEPSADVMMENITVRILSAATQRSYFNAVSKFS